MGALDDVISEVTNPEVRTLKLTTAADVTIDRPTWLWEKRIPVGGVSLVAGREGEGKTALACWLAAGVTRGTAEGAFHGSPADVIYIGSEDDHSTVMVPRLMAAGADLSRFHFVEVPAGGTFSVSVDLDSLGHLLTHEVERPALIIIDPLDSHLGGGTDTHKKAEVQAAIARLAVLIQSVRCAAIGIAHLNKGDSRDVLTKVVGSVGFTTAVRSVCAVGAHPEAPEDRVLVLRKANMTDVGSVPALRFRVAGTEVPHDDGGEPINTAKVEILGEEYGLDANAILSVPDRDERDAISDAADWLRLVLGDHIPMPSREVKALAKSADIAESTLKRALIPAGVVVLRDNAAKGRPSTWQILPDYGSRPVSDH